MIEICRKCLMPSSRPRVVFTDGVCNACHWNEERRAINWAERRTALDSILAETKRDASAYDCIVPFSGGKDSAIIAWKLKYECGLNPLLVTYGQLLWTDVGYRNFQRVAEAGFDIVYWRVNQKVSRALARRFLIERGHPKQHYDAGVNAVPLIAAVNFNIPLVFYAEHGESEYGGLVLSEEHRRSRDFTEVIENQIGDDPRNWAVDGISERDLAPYIYPDLDDIERVGVKAYYYSYFYPWDIYENAKFARERMGFEQAQNFKTKDWVQKKNAAGVIEGNWPEIEGCPRWWGKSDGSFEGFDSIDDCIDDSDFWLMHLKFGFGRATRMASRLIQKGHMTREQGLDLASRYDGEFPESYLPQVLEYLDMNRDEFMDIAEKHRNPEVWKQENGEWQLRYLPR